MGLWSELTTLWQESYMSTRVVCFAQLVLQSTRSHHAGARPFAVPSKSEVPTSYLSAAAAGVGRHVGRQEASGRGSDSGEGHPERKRRREGTRRVGELECGEGRAGRTRRRERASFKPRRGLTGRPEAISSNQQQSAAIRSISSNQQQSAAISSNPQQSAAISSNQQQSAAIRASARSSHVGRNAISPSSQHSNGEPASPHSCGIS